MEPAIIHRVGNYWTLEGMDTGIEFAICDDKESAVRVARDFVAAGDEIASFVIEGE